jgi:hypothetical protein
LLAGGGSEHAAARPLITGVNGLAGDYSPVAFQKVKETGARMVGIEASWSSIAPRQQPSGWQPADPADPHYDWSYLDSAVTNAVAAGLVPLLRVEGAPPWAQGCRTPQFPSSICEPDPAALADFAKAAASRYSGGFGGLPRVRYWQGLNEPNLSLYFDPQFRSGKPVSARLYRPLINAFYAAVKSVSRSNLVLAAGLGPIAVPRYTVGPMRFARELLCMHGRRHPRPTRGKCGGGVHFDIFDIHPYTTGAPSHRGGPDDVELGDLGKLQRLLRAADRAGRIKGRFRRTPLWITELSWDSKPPDPGGLPMRILRRWTSEALYGAWRAGVGHFFWWSLRDPARQPGNPTYESVESGLYFHGSSLAAAQPKPSLLAFRFPFVAYSSRNGFSFWGRTPDSRGGRVAIEIRRGGGWQRAARARADRHGVFRGLVRGAYGRHRHGAVRARCRGETSVPFSLRPVRDFYQPPFGRKVGK